MPTERDRCLDLLVEGMLGCVTFHHDVPDDRIEAIRAAMLETADSFLSVWDDSKARGGRLIVDETAWTEGLNVANGATLSKWVAGRAAAPGESVDKLREYEPYNHFGLSEEERNARWAAAERIEDHEHALQAARERVSYLEGVLAELRATTVNF